MIRSQMHIVIASVCINSENCHRDPFVLFFPAKGGQLRGPGLRESGRVPRVRAGPRLA